MPQIGLGLGMLLSAIAGAGGTAYAAHKQSSAAKTAAQLTTRSADTAAEIQARSAKEELDYARSVEDTRRKEWEQTQQLNYDQYRQREGRLDPYRNLGMQGVNILGATMRPGSGDAYQVRPTLNMIGQG